MADEDKKVTFFGLFERFEHPFLGPFSFYWLIINWKIPFSLLAGSGDYVRTIEFIELNYLNASKVSALLLLPLGLTLGYVVAGPYIAELLKLIPKWAQGTISKIEPVPHWKLKKAEDEAQVFRAAYNYLHNSSDHQRDIAQLLERIQGEEKRVKRAEKDLALERANKRLASSNEENDLLRNENIRMKGEEMKVNFSKAQLGKYLMSLDGHVEKLEDFATVRLSSIEGNSEIKRVIETLQVQIRPIVAGFKSFKEEVTNEIKVA